MSVESAPAAAINETSVRSVVTVLAAAASQGRTVRATRANTRASRGI